MSASNTVAFDDRTAAEESEAANALIQEFLPSYAEIANTREYSPLPLPVCVPALSSKPSSPFARGYNEVIEQTTGITLENFLQFMDGLNLAITASPPLRIIDYAGKIISFVPYHWAIIAGATMQASARAGMRILSKTRTDKYLRATNLNLFHKRGLSVRLCTTPAMLELLGNRQAKKSKGKERMNKVGRAVGGVMLQLPLPILGKAVRMVAGPAPKVAASEGPSKHNAVKRRLALVEGYAMPLDLDVPKPKKVDGLDTMQSWGVKFDKWTSNFGESRAEKDRKKVEKRRDLSEGRSRSDASLWDHVQARRDATARQRGQLLGQFLPAAKHESRAEARVADRELLEHWTNQKNLVWVVIMNSELDQEIPGIERADSLDDEERVDEQTWREEIALEEAEAEDMFKGKDTHSH